MKKLLSTLAFAILLCSVSLPVTIPKQDTPPSKIILNVEPEW
ncbi:hypothetical protein [Brevibacillus ruminantium]|nr:hypothetical protein [Brevibacillus ruminantium]